MWTYTCEQCGSEFLGYRSQHRRFCSRRCFGAAGVAHGKKTGEYKDCERCGTPFWVIPARAQIARFCSVKCKTKTNLRVLFTCENCLKQSLEYPSSKRRFCSRKCGVRFRTFRQVGECEVCGGPVDPKRNQFRFCSIRCSGLGQRTGVHVPCEQCGVPVRRTPSELKLRRKIYCSMVCKNEGMKITGPGSRFSNGTGYVAVYYPAHPDAGANGTILEHRLVMAEKLGRRLLKTEQVHHLNGIKDDNRPENLEVLSASEHTRITLRERAAKTRRELKELEKYRIRFGPLT